MRFWRILAAPLRCSGEAARLFGGRWNSRVVRVVRFNVIGARGCGNLVNLEPNLMPTDLVSIEGMIPESVETGRLDLNALPKGWRETRDESRRRFGDNWIHSGRSAALLVPSAAIRGNGTYY